MEPSDEEFEGSELESEELNLSDDDGDVGSSDEEAGARPQQKKRKLEDRLGPDVGIDNELEAEASLADLEVKELLSEAGVDLQLEGAVLELVKQVTQLLEALPAVEVGKTAAKGFLQELAFSVTKPFQFRRPTSVQPVGSFALRAATRPAPCVDLAMEMPAACFDSKDQLNHRYHAKRALYLAHVSAALKGQKGIDSITIGTLCNDPRKPVLVLHPPPGTSPSGLTIRILPTLAPSAFPLARLAPQRNNLRAATAAEGATPAAAAAAAAGGKGGEGEAGVPTPHYNTSVLQDLLLKSHHAACQAAASRTPHFGAAAALLRVWARAQGIDSGADGVGGFLLTMLLVDLLQKGTAAAGMSAMHLFRTVLVALADVKTFSKGLLMQRAAPPGAISSGTASPPDAKSWRKHFPVVFVDPSGWLNLAAHVSKPALTRAQQCAKWSLELLNAATPEGFEAALLSRQPLPSLCDYWYHVTVAGEDEALQNKAALAQDQPSWRSIEGRVEALVTQALGSRAKWVRVFRREPGAPSTLKAGAPHPQRRHILVGVQVDPTAALRAVDIGPPADQADAARAFRDFWGERSELRRFQDGAICEAVVWDCGPAERHLILDRVVSYALQRHLPQGSRVVGFAGVLDRPLRQAKHISPDYDVHTARLCEAATERLSKQLRGLTDVTLKVVSTQALSAVSRHAAVFPPLPHLLAGAPHAALHPQPSSSKPSVPRCLEPVEIVCQLEGSGKWPENVAAFLKVKAALGVQLAQALAASYGLEAQAGEGAYVDVMSEGFAFRLLLTTERDGAMQQKALAMAQAFRMDPASDLALRSWHQGAISSVAGANPAFEPSVRLAQRWAAAHMLSPHLPSEAVELLVAHCFAAPAGGAGAPGTSPPGSRTLGLLRFLRLLSDHPWKALPLIVDPDREMSGKQREEVARQHSVRRAAGSAPAMYISTPKDPACLGWTYDRPSAPMLHRIMVLARRSAEALERIMLSGSGQEGAGAPAPPAHPSKKHKGGKQQAPAPPATARKAAEVTAAAAEAALQQLFCREEGEYDVLIRLRQEALPHGERSSALPVAAGGGGERKVLRAPLDKQSRAILKGIPQSVVQSRGAAAVRRELLLGFDPLPLFVEALEQRYGFMAVFCADYVGGEVVGVKWRASAFVPGPLRPEHAHALRALLPAEDEQPRKKSKGAGGTQAPAAAAVVGDTAPDVPAILADMVAMGAGLVESVELLQKGSTS